MIRVLSILFALIGYLCTGTVIALALGVGYLWFTERLNDEKLFRIVALLHDVDLQQLADDIVPDEEYVPTEEMSLDEVRRYQQVLDRNHEVKLLALQRGRQEYDHRLRQLREQTARFDRLAREWQARLEQHEDAAVQESVAMVVRDMEQVRPAVGKDLLMRWIKEERMDDVIMLMNEMADGKLAKILKTFQTEEELDTLHEIHQRIIHTGQQGLQLDRALTELKGGDGPG